MNFIINVILQTIGLRDLLTVSIHFLHLPWENLSFQIRYPNDQPK